MLMPSNSQGLIPLTPNKLNFILSQSKRQVKQKSRQIFDHNLSQQFSHRQAALKQRTLNKQSKGTQINFYPNQQILIRDKKNKCIIQQNPINVYQNNLWNDSLDQFVTQENDNKTLRTNQERNTYQCYENVDRTQRVSRFTSDQKQNMGHKYSPFKQQNISNCQKENYHSLNKSYDLQNLSPNKILKQNQDVQYFQYQQQSSRKRVNWNLQPITFQENRKYKNNMQDSFRQISRELSKITYELNSNSKKMHQMKKLYSSAKKKLSPQQCLKRANLKFSNMRGKQNLQCSIRRRPQVQYEDKIYKDPGYLIWQPQH